MLINQLLKIKNNFNFDSLVGYHIHKIVKMLYDSGAKEVHVRIACPEIKYPDFYGVDTPTKKELLLQIKLMKFVNI